MLGLVLLNVLESISPILGMPSLFETDSFPPRWMCGDWSETHGWVHIISDIAIWLAYMAIPFAILYYLRKRPDLPFHVLFYLFIAFIALCGFTHLMDALIFWWPAYRFLGLLKLLTAIVSVATVLSLLPLLPKLIQIPTRKQLEDEIMRREATEKHLRESEEIFRSAMDNAPIGKALVSLDGTFIQVNRKTCELFDYSREELEKITFQEITHPDDLEKDLSLLRRALEGDINEYAMEKRYIRRNGDVINCILSVVLVRQDGVPQYFISQIVDISPIKQLQVRQQRLIHELQQKSRDLQQIFYVASHDLRSPLVNIIGFSSEMETAVQELDASLRTIQDLPEPVRHIMNNEIPEMLYFITSSGRRMDRLLKGLLEYSRLGRYPVETQEIDMNKLIAEMVQDLSFQLKQIDAVVDVAPLPNCFGDLTLVQQLFRNLIDNAIKYRSPDRTLHLTISVQEEPMHYRYMVEDNGIGIEDKCLKKIFEVFHRLNPADSEGDGLGLSICSLIAHRLEGGVEVQSTFGAGSTFLVDLPRDAITLTQRADALHAISPSLT